MGTKRFRSRLDVIEAHQFTGNNATECLLFMGIPMHIAMNEMIHETDRPLIITGSATLPVEPLEWIIKGQSGNFYACKPDTFAALFRDV